MKFLAHSIRVCFTILANPYPYGKMAVLRCYLRLLRRSAVYHKITSRRGGTVPVTLTERVMGYEVLFNNYTQLINLFEEIFIFQAYYFASANTRPFIIDCGSHLGLSILYFKKLYPASVGLGFEPHAKTFTLLQYNLASNLLRNISTHNAALTNQEGKSTLYGEVEIRKLSRYIDQPVDLLKIDVEGSEVEILRDLLSTGKIRFVREIIMEYHPGLSSVPLDTLVQELTAAGFSCSCKRAHLRAGATPHWVYCRANPRSAAL